MKDIYMGILVFFALGLSAYSEDIISIKLLKMKGDVIGKVDYDFRHFTVLGSAEVGDLLNWRCALSKKAGDPGKSEFHFYQRSDQRGQENVYGVSTYGIQLRDVKEIQFFWPTSNLLKISPLAKEIKAPTGKRICIVDSSANALSNIKVDVFYDSSKRRESYSSDKDGLIELNKSNLNSGSLVVFFEGSLKFIIQGKSSWENGLIIVRPYSIR